LEKALPLAVRNQNPRKIKSLLKSRDIQKIPQKKSILEEGLITGLHKKGKNKEKVAAKHNVL
jgi:hypothetical protein